MNVEVLLMFFSRESDSRITIDRPSVCLKTIFLISQIRYLKSVL